jgi:hypothetical protein
MTLGDRTILIDRMIRENPDATIKEYLELVKEFDQINETNGTIETALMKHRIRDIPITINRQAMERYRIFK